MTASDRDPRIDREGSPAVDPADADLVREYLGREPLGPYDVAVRDPDGTPIVIRNAPLLSDGTPMPTRWWLIGPDQVRRVSRLEAAGGVRDAERSIDPDALRSAHASYAAERDAAVPDGHDGPRPSGGVGGTREGVKCLHAHYAWFLAGGDDPVGRWVADRLRAEDRRLRIELHPASVVLRGGSWDESLPITPDHLGRTGLLSNDPPDPVDLTNALGAIDDELTELELRHPELVDLAAIEIGGSLGRTLASVEVGVDDPPASVTLSRYALEDVFRTVATESRADRAYNPGLPAEHLDSIVAGCCVAVALTRHFHLDGLTVVDAAGASPNRNPRTEQ